MPSIAPGSFYTIFIGMGVLVAIISGFTGVRQPILDERKRIREIAGRCLKNGTIDGGTHDRIVNVIEEHFLVCNNKTIKVLFLCKVSFLVWIAGIVLIPIYELSYGETGGIGYIHMAAFALIILLLIGLLGLLGYETWNLAELAKAPYDIEKKAQDELIKGAWKR